MPRPFFDEFGFGMESNDYTAILKGASEDPTAVTYSKQSALTAKFGPMVFFIINLTTTSITKTTIADAIQINLPFVAANLPFTNHDCPVIVSMDNATILADGVTTQANAGVILKNTSLLRLNASALDTRAIPFTYALLGCTSGVAYTNTVIMLISGSYIAVSNAG